jgi:hypothetical protein
LEKDLTSIRYPIPQESRSCFDKAGFSRLLRETLASRYGKLPSAAFVAREFNLRAYGCEPITQESARRWLRGLSIPSGKRLGVLQAWLKFDLNPLFSGALPVQELSPQGTSVAMPDWHVEALSMIQGLSSNCEVHQSGSEAFLCLYDGLPAHYKALIYVIAHQLHLTRSDVASPYANENSSDKDQAVFSNTPRSTDRTGSNGSFQ